MNKNPLVSFCLLTYNQEPFIEEALYAALAQTYSPLEIIVSDDFSKDKTRDKITKIIKEYEGEHNIRVNFNDQNIGLASNFSNTVNLARGKYVIVAAGDDISKPERTDVSVDFMERNKNCFIADFHVDFIDEFGKLTTTDPKEKNLKFSLADLLGNRVRGVRGCSRIYRRELIETYGNLNPDCPTEDSPAVWRGLMMGEIWVAKEKLVLYRKHGASISSPINMVKLNTGKIIQQYLDDIERAFQLNKISKQEYLELIQLAKREKRRRANERVLKYVKNIFKSWKNRL